MLLEQGWTGIERWIRDQQTALPDAAQSTALDGLREYLGSHQDHLHYGQRLAEGRSIGSGQVEGACKNLIGRRLKANASRWRLRRVNRMAGLCCVMYSHQWTAYWNPGTHSPVDHRNPRLHPVAGCSRPRHTSGLQVIDFSAILCERTVGVAPRSEVVQLALDLLGPNARRVWE
jgi:hypothetical protein